MMNDYRPCWFKDGDDWEPGTWHEWSQNYKAIDNISKHYPAAIVEDPLGRCHVIYAGDILFKDPNKSVEEQEMLKEEYTKEREPKVYPRAGKVMTAEEQKMVKEPGFFIEPVSFKPRYFRISEYWHLFMVRPDIAEIFTNVYASFRGRHPPIDIVRFCQVEWFAGKVVCSQAGIPIKAIPIKAITTIFKKVNSA